MKTIPVRHAVLPKYPDKYAIDTGKMLLYYRPKRWNSLPAVGGVLAAVIALGLTGCSQYYYKIPLFEHGRGTGTFGCDSVASPHFLSEEEARDVIRSELQAAGLTYKDGRTIKNAVIPAIKDNRRWYTTASGLLETDGTTVNQIGIEFVSGEDFENWDLFLPSGSITTYHLHSAADKLMNNENLAVFYDPIEFVPLRPNEEEIEAAKEKSIELLKEQIQDFIEWLQAQEIV